MDVHETRRTKLRALIDEKFGKRQAALAAAVERQPDYISRLLSGKKKLGEELAREIEAKTGKHPGWLDGAEETATQWDATTIEWANWFQSLGENERKRMTVMALLLRDGADFGRITELIPALPKDYVLPTPTTGEEVQPHGKRKERAK